MKKIISLFAAVLFAGSMMAADPTVVLDFTQNAWGFPATNETTEKSYTNGDYTITVNAADGHKAQKSGAVVKALLFGKSGATLTLPAMTFNVSKIVVNGNAGASSKVTFNIFVDETEVSTEATSSVVNHEFAIAAAQQAAGTVYVIQVTNGNNCQISSVEFYKAVTGAPENPTFSVAAGVYESAQSVALACETEGAEIRYTLDGSDPTSSSALYSTPIAVATTTTIKAIAIKNSISSDIVSARYKIVSLEGSGTGDDPYSVADVIALEGSRPAAAWVKGYILGGAATGGSPSVLQVADSLTQNNTAMAIADAKGEADIEKVVSVQLGKNIRQDIADNAGIGALVKVYGTLELYLTVQGVKGLTTAEHYVIINTPTAIDETEAAGKATKELREGQVLIIKGNKTYNILGQEIR